MADSNVPVQNKPSSPASRTAPQTPWDGWRPFREDMNRLFDRFATGFGFPLAKQALEGFPSRASGSSFSVASPAVDVTEDAAAYKITAELPGMTEKDIEVTVSGDLVTLKGEKREEREDKSDNYHISERSYGSFQRSFYVPDGVDREKLSAEFSKGVLTLTLPKTPDAQKASKTIEVKAS